MTETDALGQFHSFLDLATAVVYNNERPGRRSMDEAAQRVKDIWETHAKTAPASRPPRREVQAQADAIWARDEAETMIWELWEQSWDKDPSVRPSMTEVVKRMRDVIEADPSF